MDIQILLALQSLRTPIIGNVAYGITVCAETTALMVVVCALYWCVNKKSATYVIFNFLLGMWMNNLLKVTVCAVRPWLRDARIAPYEKALASATGTSFPSGHTAGATAAYGGIAVLLWNKKRWASVLLIIFTLLIGLSRLVLGVHTPQDVLVSLAIGVILLFAVHRLVAALEKRPSLDAAIAVIFMLLGIGLFLYTRFKPYPEGHEAEWLKDAYSVSGILVGAPLAWLLERRTVRFSESGPIWFQLAKLALGLASLVGLRALLKPLCAPLGDALSNAVRYGLMMLWGLWLYPALFERVRRRIQ